MRRVAAVMRSMSKNLPTARQKPVVEGEEEENKVEKIIQQQPSELQQTPLTQPSMLQQPSPTKPATAATLRPDQVLQPRRKNQFSQASGIPVDQAQIATDKLAFQTWYHVLNHQDPLRPSA